MFKKKDLVNKADDGIPARFVKKDGIMRGILISALFLS